MSKIFLCGITPAPPHPNIEKVSLGAERYLEWEKCRDAWRVIKKLKKENYQIISLEKTRKAAPYYKFRPAKKKMALIIGNEVRGLPKSILKKSNKIIYIPMFGKKESLNVAVAFGIAIYHLRNYF